MENLHCHPHHPPGGADKNAHTYVDDPQVYAANEIAIHSNAPWVFLPAGVLEGE